MIKENRKVLYIQESKNQSISNLNAKMLSVKRDSVARTCERPNISAHMGLARGPNNENPYEHSKQVRY